uniref:Odorant binding protein 3 n=1 Tax=Conogethes pinicolalis TaxID=1178461 RepID=A0A5B9GEA0_9NEOP|nr:odorant binding protein 3 [Conogethes pinicolalis]
MLALKCMLDQASKANSLDEKNMIRDKFESVGEECIDKHPLSDEDIAALENKMPPPGRVGACFVACVMKNVGVMDDAGMLQKETALELAREAFDDEEELESIAEFLHECSSINSVAVSDGEEGCDRAILALKCMNEHESKFGLDF